MISGADLRVTTRPTPEGERPASLQRCRRSSGEGHLWVEPHEQQEV